MKNLKNIILVLGLTSYALLQPQKIYGQAENKDNRLQATVKGLHRVLEHTSRNTNPKGRYFGKDHVLIYDKGKVNRIPIDSLRHLNFLDYEIKIVYDYLENEHVAPAEIYQGVVILYPLSKKRIRKFVANIEALKKKKAI